MKTYFTAFLLLLMIQPPAQSQPAARLEEVASFGKNQPIGVTVAPRSNRLFVGFPHKEPFLYGLTEIVQGKRVPFPDEEWNQYRPDQPDSHFINVQDLYTDDQNTLWVLDSAPGGGAAILGQNQQQPTGRFKLVQIDLETNRVRKVYPVNDIPTDKSALNDVCVDTGRQLAYLSDPGLRAIVVLDLKTGTSRVVLANDPATLAQPGFVLHLDGKDVVDQTGKPFVSNVNGIALTHDHRYFYFRAINQTKLYRIETRYLADPALKDAERSRRVETVAETGVCHGMIADANGIIYQTSSPDYSIKYVSPDRKVHTLVQDDRLSWPDSFGIGSDVYLYFSCSQMNRLPKYNDGVDKTAFPYRIYRVKLPR